MYQDEIVTNQISERIIGCAFRVMNTLGSGFLEKVHENALAHELRKSLPLRRRGPVCTSRSNTR
jgi:GxxExxY protein